MAERLCNAIGDVMLGVFPYQLIGPCPHERNVPRHVREVHAWMCYPYLHLHWGMLAGTLPPIGFPPSRGIPLLYVYGARKRAMFHSPGFLRSIEDESEHVRLWRQRRSISRLRARARACR